jgi:signal transduction histidine kinase
MSVRTPLATGKARWLRPARLLALGQCGLGLLSLFALALVALGAPHEYAILSQPCAQCQGPRLTPAGVAELAGYGISPGAYAGYLLSFEILFVLVWIGVGALIFWRRRADPFALLVALMLVSFGVAFPGTAAVTGAVYPALQPLILSVFYIGVVSFVAFFFVFPDGRFVPRWTSVVVAGWAALSIVVMALLAGDFFRGDGQSSPGGAAYFMLYYLLLAGGVIAQIWRYRRTTDIVQRQQTKLVVAGISVAIGAFLLLNAVAMLAPQAPQLSASPLTSMLFSPLYHLFMQLIPLAIGVSILRFRLWDIDPFLSRALVYGALTACVLGIYVLVVAGLGALFEVRGNPLIALTATGLVAVLFQPLRARVQAAVNRLVYGERDDPYTALARLGRRLDSTVTLDSMLPAIVETVALALGSPYVALLIRQGDTLVVGAEYPAAVGAPVPGFRPAAASAGDLDSVPLAYQGQAVGELRLARGAHRAQLRSADRRLLSDLARQAGTAVHAVRLTADLRASREHVVIKREEERRRLRRDLHDGLGPMLASHALQLEAARDLLDERPELAIQLLGKILGQSGTMLADMRRLINALRPPALDELGLAGAIAQMADQYAHTGLQIHIDVPAHLPELPAAVEVAAYRIVQEALTNIARHAQARHCLVHLAAGDILLVLEIADDGVGLPAQHRAGVGLRSMQERAEELGGQCSVKAGAQGGTSVMIFLPVPPSDSEYQEQADASIRI